MGKRKDWKKHQPPIWSTGMRPWNLLENLRNLLWLTTRTRQWRSAMEKSMSGAISALEWAWDHCWSTGSVSQQKTNWIQGGGKWSVLNLLLWELLLLFLTVYSHTANRDNGYCLLSAFLICTNFSAIARKPKGSNHEKHISS